MFARPSSSLSIACLALPVLVHARTDTCYDPNDNITPCPKEALSTHQVALIVVFLSLIVVGSVGFFLFRIFRQRRAQKYNALPPPPGVQGGVMTPAPPGEMGYAGPQPELLYMAPTLGYNAPQAGKPHNPAYLPPSGPPPQSAATYYGYSAGAI